MSTCARISSSLPEFNKNTCRLLKPGAKVASTLAQGRCGGLHAAPSAAVRSATPSKAGQRAFAFFLPVCFYTTLQARQ